MDKPIAVLDYASLYPSSMISENISHDSKVWTKEYDLEGNLIKVWGEKNEDGNFKYDNLDDLFTQSDIICVTCSLNDETKSMINYSLMRKMKMNACLINTSRGEIIDEDDDEICVDNDMNEWPIQLENK